MKTIKNANNLRQNIWNKVNKSSKTGQGYKSLVSTFASFLTAIANTESFGGFK